MDPVETRRNFLTKAFATGTALTLPSLLVKAANEIAKHASGSVFHDLDGDGRFGPTDKGIEGIAVTNGREVTLTDAKGRWQLPLLTEAATDFHVIPSSVWQTPLDSNGRRNFHHIHQTSDSPAARFPGVMATGPLPASIDFPLVPLTRKDRFSIAVCGDPQPRNNRELRYLTDTIPGAVISSDADFGVAMGDIVFDDLALLDGVAGTLAACGIPWHYVIGNHDLNFDAVGPIHSRSTFRKKFGPTCSAFNHGKVHFIILDNVEWLGPQNGEEISTRQYRGNISENQLEFIKNDLDFVPEDHLIVIFMHIPLFSPYSDSDRSFTANRAALYRLLEKRPHTLSFSAHTHTLQHMNIGAEDGWQGARHHHHIISGATCGSWFSGAPGVDGIPHATLSDGTPRGFLKATFDGNQYDLSDYRPFTPSSAEKFHIHLPDTTDTHGCHVNIYNAGFTANAKMKLPGEEWKNLEKTERKDPRFLALAERDANIQEPYRPLTKPTPCSHLWSIQLPENLTPGFHRLDFIIDDGHGIQKPVSRVVNIPG